MVDDKEWYDREDWEDEDLPEDIQETFVMSPEDKDAAIQAFLAKGGKVKHLPTRMAKDVIFLGGRPQGVVGDDVKQT